MRAKCSSEVENRTLSLLLPSTIPQHFICVPKFYQKHREESTATKIRSVHRSVLECAHTSGRHQTSIISFVIEANHPLIIIIITSYRGNSRECTGVRLNGNWNGNHEISHCIGAGRELMGQRSGAKGWNCNASYHWSSQLCFISLLNYLLLYYCMWTGFLLLPPNLPFLHVVSECVLGLDLVRQSRELSSGQVWMDGTGNLR